MGGVGGSDVPAETAMIYILMESPLSYDFNQLRREFCDRVIGLETKYRPDSLECHAVVAGINGTGLISYLDLGQKVTNQVNYHPFCVVFLVASDVKHLSINPRSVGLQNQTDCRTDVIHMAVWSPRVGVIYQQLATQSQLPCELVDGKVEPHPRRQTISRSSPKNCHAVIEITFGAKQPLLHFHLRLGVERLRIQCSVFGRGGIVRLQSIIAACGHEDEPLNIKLVQPVNQFEGAVLVDMLRYVGEFFAHRIADQRSQMDDIGNALHRLIQVRLAAEVTALKSKTSSSRQATNGGGIVVQESIQHSNAVAAIKQSSRQNRADITSATDHQYMSISLWHNQLLCC